MTTNRFSDEQLTAYLDGELDTATAEVLERDLASDQALAGRLDSLLIDNDALKGAFDTLLHDAPAFPEQVVEQATPPSVSSAPTWRLTSVAAAAVVVACLSSAVTFWATRPTLEAGKWFDYVAAYQALYTTETLSQVSADRDNLESELARATAAVGRQIELSAVNELPGLTYKRAQILGFNGRQLAQLTFLDEDGDPIAICVIPSDASDMPAHTADLEGMASERWIDKGHAFLIIGGNDQAQVSTIASSFRERVS